MSSEPGEWHTHMGRRIYVTHKQQKQVLRLLEEGRSLRDKVRKHVEPMLTLSEKARNLVLK